MSMNLRPASDHLRSLQAIGPVTGRFGPRPIDVALLIEELNLKLVKIGREGGHNAPVGVTAAQWWSEGKHSFCRLVIDVAPGYPDRPLRSWYQWQHVRFAQVPATPRATPDDVDVAEINGTSLPGLPQ